MRSSSAFGFSISASLRCACGSVALRPARGRAGQPSVLTLNASTCALCASASRSGIGFDGGLVYAVNSRNGSPTDWGILSLTDQQIIAVSPDGAFLSSAFPCSRCLGWLRVVLVLAARPFSGSGCLHHRHPFPGVCCVGLSFATLVRNACPFSFRRAQPSSAG